MKTTLTKRILSIITVIALLLAFGLFAIASSDSEGSDNSNPEDNSNNTVESNNKFSSKPQISASAHIKDNIIGYPELTVSIENTSDKDIAAAKFYVIAYDVYGEEITGFLAQNHLSTDKTIKAGATESRTWQFLANNIKTVKLYVYSIYYTDGSEWGDREAVKSTILENAYIISVSKDD